MRWDRLVKGFEMKRQKGPPRLLTEKTRVQPASRPVATCSHSNAVQIPSKHDAAVGLAVGSCGGGRDGLVVGAP